MMEFSKELLQSSSAVPGAGMPNLTKVVSPKVCLAPKYCPKFRLARHSYRLGIADLPPSLTKRPRMMPPSPP